MSDSTAAAPLDLENTSVEAALEQRGDPAIVRLPGGASGQLAAREVGARQVGERFAVYVDRWEKDHFWVSAVMAERLALWERLAAAAGKEDVALDAEVVAAVKGGLVVDVGMRGFLPASQLELAPAHDLAAYVGKRLAVTVLEVDAQRGQVIVTRRPILARERAVRRKASKLAVGEVRSGVVLRFAPFGMFVDVDGFDGLVHNNDVAWGRAAPAQELFSVGQELRVKVLAIEPDKERLALGVKQLSEDPWLRVPERFPAGARCRGTVARLADFGAFVEVAPGVEGLVHASELAWTRRPKHPSAYVQPGAPIEVVVLGADVPSRRLSLSLKQTQPSPWVTFAAQQPPGSRVRGIVTGVAEFGVFVRPDAVAELEGLVHAADIAWDTKLDAAALRERFEKGAAVDAVVLECDVRAERLSLGIKQLSEDPRKDVADARAGDSGGTDNPTGGALSAALQKHLQRKPE